MNLREIFANIGIDRDYSTMDFSGLALDLQGWNSAHPIFKHMLQQVKPATVIEVGSWKGASVIHMAKLARSLGLRSQFICVDTWLGSNPTLWLNPEWRNSLMVRNGYPSMFRQFVYNIRASEVAEDIFPLPMTSSCAYNVMKRLKISADLIYIDAGHDEEEVAMDLRLYYELLAPGGWLFGDDYGVAWMGVIAAVNRFCADNRLPLGTSGPKWWVQKAR